MANCSSRRGGIAVKSQPETELVSRGSCHGCGQTISRARAALVELLALVAIPGAPRTVCATCKRGDADLGLDARRFLGFNPHDEEVRAALGRLPREYMYP